METFWAVVIGVLSGLGGATVSAYFGPKRLEEWRARRREERWAAPRKDLLRRKLESAKGGGWVSLKLLARLSGTDDAECRSLLIEIGARGGTLKGDREGWALISRQPLDATGAQDADDDDNG